MKNSALSRVENLIRRVVEEPFTWLGGAPLDPFQLATHLSRYYEGANENEGLPNHFRVLVNPDDYREIEGELGVFERQVEEYVVLMAGRRGYHLDGPPIVRLEENSQENVRSAHIIATHLKEQYPADTAVYATEFEDLTQLAIQSTDAFLILQGRQHIALDRPIIRIGRRIDNDIVLDTPSISRHHAQIRWRHRYFVLHDVSSQGHTFVNGLPVREHILRPGDVITLSDIYLVYGEGRDDMLDTPPIAQNDEMDTTMFKPEK